MKLVGILTGIGAFFTQAWRIVRAIGKLKSLKKEVLEFYEAGLVAYHNADKTIKELKSYVGEDSDGGKKLTAKEVKEATELLTDLSKDLKLVFKEGLDAKDEIKKLIESIKKPGN